MAGSRRFPKLRPFALGASYVAAGVLSVICASSTVFGQTADRPAFRPDPPLQGSSFQSTETRDLQADDGANPGLLWVDQGQKLWAQPAGPDARSCQSCHGDAAATMRGVAARYPAVDASTGSLFNLEARINHCRTMRQGATALPYESQPLLSLTAFITVQSRGLPRSVAIDGPAAPYFDQGRRFFMTRQGQLNVACVQCHDDSVGRKLRGDTISQGQTVGWPAYRLEWQTLGSLHRRLRACSLGVRAEILDFGSPDYVALELYLAWRAKDLVLESPAVRH